MAGPSQPVPGLGPSPGPAPAPGPSGGIPGQQAHQVVWKGSITVTEPVSVMGRGCRQGV